MFFFRSPRIPDSFAHGYRLSNEFIRDLEWNSPPLLPLDIHGSRVLEIPTHIPFSVLISQSLPLLLGAYQAPIKYCTLQLQSLRQVGLHPAPEFRVPLFLQDTLANILSRPDARCFQASSFFSFLSHGLNPPPTSPFPSPALYANSLTLAILSSRPALPLSRNSLPPQDVCDALFCFPPSSFH